MQTAAAELTQNPIGHAPRMTATQLLRQAAAEEKAAIEQSQMAARAAQVEASHARVAQLAVLRDALTEKLQEYETLRHQIRAVFGEAWAIEKMINTVSGGQVSALPRGLEQNHLAPAFPGPMDEVFPAFRSFTVDIQHAAAHRGVWPTK